MWSFDCFLSEHRGLFNFRQFSGMLTHMRTVQSIFSGMLNSIWTAQSIFLVCWPTYASCGPYVYQEFVPNQLEHVILWLRLCRWSPFWLPLKLWCPDVGSRLHVWHLCGSFWDLGFTQGRPRGHHGAQISFFDRCWDPWWNQMSRHFRKFASFWVAKISAERLICFLEGLECLGTCKSRVLQL